MSRYFCIILKDRQISDYCSVCFLSSVNLNYLLLLKIVDCIPLSGDADDHSALIATEFELTEEGDVNWFPSDAREDKIKQFRTE
jgi:hypothetical protein